MSQAQQTDLLTFDLRLLYARAAYANGEQFALRACDTISSLEACRFAGCGGQYIHDCLLSTHMFQVLNISHPFIQSQHAKFVSMDLGYFVSFANQKLTRIIPQATRVVPHFVI